jgi:tetratricopeptide (TPR) repeat protein
LGLARSAQLAGNQEEALSYFNRVLEADPTVSEAWMGKGKAAAWQSSLAHIRAAEGVVAFGHAIATARESEKMATTEQAVEEINRLVATLYGMARRQLDQFVALPDMWTQYISQISQLISALEEVRIWSPHNKTTLENIVHLCKDNIEGISYNDPYDNNVSKAWHLSTEYEALLKSRLDAAVEALRQSNPNYSAPLIEKKQPTECFVVTATMGDVDHPTVVVMRRFRDEWLIQRLWGRICIGHYYRLGPHVARRIAPSWALRQLAYCFVVLPAAAVAKRLLQQAYR